VTILFDLFPASGHLNSCLFIAGRLKNAGHKVVFCVDSTFESFVNSKGFETVLTSSRFISPDRFELSNKGLLFFIECFISFFTKSRQNLIHENVSDFMENVMGIKPDIAFLDSHLSYKTIAYHFLSIPVLSIETMPLSLFDPLVPPFTSDSRYPFSALEKKAKEEGVKMVIYPRHIAKRFRKDVYDLAGLQNGELSHSVCLIYLFLFFSIEMGINKFFYVYICNFKIY
jgi:UDP:flavonoid glycosyltransferase YjiC (YdhE family)